MIIMIKFNCVVLLLSMQVIRSYHGHLSGVYGLALHPSLDILFSGGRDAVVRMWDMRTRVEIHTLCGHEGMVGAIETMKVDPQVLLDG